MKKTYLVLILPAVATAIAIAKGQILIAGLFIASAVLYQHLATKEANKKSN